MPIFLPRTRLFGIARKSPRRARCRRNCGACAEALRAQSRYDLVTEIFFAAKQVLATGNIEKQTLRRINDHNRRKTLTPGGNIIERARVFFRLCFHRFQFWLHRTRVSQRHCEVQPKLACARIHAFQLKGAILLRINRQRAIVRRPAPSADQPIRPDAWQIDREPARVL